MNNLPLTPDELAHRIARTQSRWEGIPEKFRFPNQTLGRTQAIGCVALEITQRCNLDCTLCYLSEHSESVPDLPLAEVKRRVDLIREQFGAGTNVQVTGGDPTMRPVDELTEIVRYIRAQKLSPALFTNGIKATRKLLARLHDAGLADVAFHVDTTQERPGYRSEADLNKVREEYIARASGLGLPVYFNTTVHHGNFHEIPDLARFFIRHADTVGIASFQLQADTGRGLLRKRELAIDLDTVSAQLDLGVGQRLNWDAVHLGHPLCHRQAVTVVLDGQVVDLLDDPALIARAIPAFSHLPIDRSRPWRAALAVLGRAAKHPSLWPRAALYLARKLRVCAGPLVRGRCQPRKLMFFLQNFQDRDALDPERIELCSFHVMTQHGPISMCLHNASRDDYILPENQPGVYPAGTQPVRGVAPHACGGCSRCA